MKTKNIIAILAAMPIVALTVACSSDEEKEAKPAKETLMVVGGSIQQYAADEQRAEFQVQADCRWTISESDIVYGDFSKDELSISPHQGNGNGTIIITSQKNTDTKAREASFIIVSDGGLKQKITIQQNKAADNLIVNVQELHYQAQEGLTKIFSVYSNGSWEITGMPSWLHLDVTSGSAGTYDITAVCDSIMDDAARTANLTVKSGTQTPQYITVNQEGLEFDNIKLELEPAREVYFNADGGEYGVKVWSNADWHVVLPEGANEWLSISTTQGSGDGEFFITCRSNESSAYQRLSSIVVYAGTKARKQRELSVLQAAAEYPELGELFITDSEIGTTWARLSFSLSTISEGFGIRQVGICYSHDNKVPTDNDRVVEGSLTGAEISGLNEKTTYYVRAYAISTATPEQKVYSRNVVMFTTGSSIVTPGNNDNPNPTPAPRFSSRW
jgi:hypothetical protein